MLENIKHRIFPATKQTKESEGYLRQIDIDKLEPIMVRREFSEKDIIKLANSICKSGVLFPIPVYTDGKTYKYISGSRRIAACMLLGRKSIICHVYTSTETRDKLLIASIMHEKTPNPFDIYSLICYFQDNQLLSFGEIAEKLGITPLRISELVKLECFSFEERRIINQINLTEDAIIELAKLSDPDVRNTVIMRLHEENTGKNTKIRKIVRQIRTERIAEHANGTEIIDNSFGKLLEMLKNVGKRATLRKQETVSATSYTVTVAKPEPRKFANNVSRETSKHAQV